MNLKVHTIQQYFQHKLHTNFVFNHFLQASFLNEKMKRRYVIVGCGNEFESNCSIFFCKMFTTFIERKNLQKLYLIRFVFSRDEAQSPHESTERSTQITHKSRFQPVFQTSFLNEKNEATLRHCELRK